MMNLRVNDIDTETQEVNQPDAQQQQRYDFSKVDGLLVKIQIIHYRKIGYRQLANMFKCTTMAISSALDEKFPGRRILEGIARWLVSTGTPYERLVPHECKVNIGVPDDQE